MEPITREDIQIMRLLNDMQSMATSVHIKNKHDSLRDWVADLERSLNTLVEFHNRRILERNLLED